MPLPLIIVVAVAVVVALVVVIKLANRQAEHDFAVQQRYIAHVARQEATKQHNASMARLVAGLEEDAKREDEEKES